MANTPNIRFKGFTDDWEQHELCDIYGKIRNAFVGTASPYYVENGHFYLESNNVKDGHINHNNEVFINDEFYEKQRDNWLHTGDIVMVQSGHVGHSAVIPEELNNTAAHALIIISNPQTEIDPYFLNAEFQTPLKKKNIDIITKGNTIKHILASDMKEFEVSLPNIREQRDISAFFRILDKILIIHQRRLEDLKNFKKVMLQKMFPSDGESIPEIRFFGFSDAWEQRKLSDAIVDIADGPFGSNLKTEHYTDEKEARIIQLSNLSDYGWQEANTRYTTFEHAKEIRRCIVNEGELVMGKMMPAGMTIIRPNTEKMYVLSSDCVRIKLDKNVAIDDFFLYTTKSETFLNQVNNDSQGSTRVRTSISKIREMDIATPSLEEQAKIGEYFTNLDHLITLHQHKYENLLKMKKYLLQQMFC